MPPVKPDPSKLKESFDDGCTRLRDQQDISEKEVNMYLAKTFGLFVVTAIAEIVGCYLPYLWLKKGATAWVLVPAILSLALFVWLLTLHPHAAGRIYAAYGGVYIGVAISWLWVVDAVRPTTTDLVGVAISLVGMAVIMIGANPE